MKTRVLVVNDHQIVREGLALLLEKENDLEVIAETADGKSALYQVRKHHPDVVIMDVTMPKLNGIEATRKILIECPQIKVIGLSMYSNKHFIAKMLQAGARGYLLKDCATKELIKAIRVVIKNKIYISRSLEFPISKNILNGSKLNDLIAISFLSPKELEVLQLVAEGKSSKEISARMQVSVKTIEKHRGRIMDKLNIRTIAELTKYAIREGLTSLEK
jgi:DNA-binding NarL/FixJ family response regulator